MEIRRASWVLPFFTLCALGCGSGSTKGGENATATVPARESKPAPTLEETFEVTSSEAYWAHFAFRPADAVELGYHQYDGQLPDHSRPAIAAEVVRLRALERTLAGFDEGLSALSRLERDVFLAEIRSELFELDTIKRPFTSPIFYLGAVNLSDYATRDYAPEAERAAAVSRLCEYLPAYLKQARDNLQSPIPEPWIDIALIQTRGRVSFVRDDLPGAFPSLRPDQAADLAASLENCAGTLEEFVSFLELARKEATQEFALGPVFFLRMLRDQEGVDIDLDRLTSIGRADMARNQKALADAARELSGRLPVAKVVARAKRDQPAADKVIAVAEEQAAAMRQFLLDREIVSIPSDDAAEIQETPAFMRFNFAFLSSAGEFETKKLPSFYYISPPDPSWPRAEQRAYIPSRGDLLSTTIHELWPGHFLHFLHKKNHESRILKSFCTYSMSEGWAHYTEEMMWEQGAAGTDPALRIGQLGDALLRDARYLSAIGMHTRGMTVGESAALFRSVAHSDRATARQQAVRGTIDPGYLNYTLGKLMILKLREDWKAKQGDSYSLKAFHDAFLSYGCAPIPVIRRQMLGEDAGPAL